jgi:hypothetical protein
MIGVIVVFAISWLLLWFIEREHITVLGILPNGKRLKAFFVGMVVMAVFCLINLLGQAYFKEFNYVRNIDYGFKESLNGIWWTFKAAFFEELIFRGALLYLLIKRLGINWACIISAIAFGIYHWFSYQMFGRGLVPMAYVFILTGASGWMFAYAFAKTKSILVPLGLHFGWIVISIVVLSAGPLGDSFYVADGKGVDLSGWEQLLFFLWQTLIVPGVITWYIFKNYKRREV